MPSGLIPILLGAALAAGAVSYLSAYHQISHSYVAREARQPCIGMSLTTLRAARHV